MGYDRFSGNGLHGKVLTLTLTLTLTLSNLLVFTSRLPCHIVMRIEVNFPNCGGHSTT